MNMAFNDRRDVVADLERVLPSGRVVRDPAVIDGLSRDQAVWAPVGQPSPWSGPSRPRRCVLRWRLAHGAGFPSSRGVRGPACPEVPTRSTAASCSPWRG